MVYEALLLFGVGFFSISIFLMFSGVSQSNLLTHAKEAFLFLSFGVYFVYFWTKKGQTLAMQTWRIRLVNIENGRVSHGQAALRYILSWSWFIAGYIIAKIFGLNNSALLAPIFVCLAIWITIGFFSSDKQFLHDRLAKTKLIEVPAINKKNESLPT